MNTETDPFDELGDLAAQMFDAANDASPLSICLRSKPAESLPVEGEFSGTPVDWGKAQMLSEVRKQFQALSRQMAEERRQFIHERQRLLDENQRLAQENLWLAQENQRAADQDRLLQRLTALNQFGVDLENAPDAETSALLMARLLQKTAGCDLVCIFSCRPMDHHLQMLAAAGPAAASLPNSLLLDWEHASIRQAVFSLKPTIAALPEQDNQFHAFPGPGLPALLATPIMQKNQMRGLILLAHSSVDRFTSLDFPMVETAAGHLVTAWEYARKTEAITDFVQAATSLSMIQETGSLMEMIGLLARRLLNARFTLIATLNQQEWMIRDSGKAPRLQASLRNGGLRFLDEAILAPYTFRLRDLRGDERAACLDIDGPELCTLLCSPIRINGTTIGILMAFGKTGEPGFTDTDVFMAERLTAQAAVNLDSCYLNQELRSSLKTTQLLYDLSLDIAQAEDLHNAARAIARTAYRLLQARTGGMILFSADGRKEAEVCFPQDDDTILHPYSLIQQAMDSRQTIYLSESETTTRVAIPIQTMRRCYGALWLELPDGPEETRHPTEEIRILVNQAAVALERSILLEETRQQTTALRQTNQRLVDSYDQMLDALMRALDARDSETEGHSARVKKMAMDLGKSLGLSKTDIKALERGALLHDIGKIGISDAVLLKPGPLDTSEWQAMRKHPQIGARIIQEIPALHDALPVIAFHQERWDGQGYPLRLSGVEIPLLARIFAVVDVYDALTSDRPYRKKLPQAEVLGYLRSEAGKAFDPEIVDAFIEMIQKEGE